MVQTTQNISKFTNEQDMFAKWTIDGVKRQFNKNWLGRHLKSPALAHFHNILIFEAEKVYFDMLIEFFITKFDSLTKC
jgi:hypothetical protein